MVKQKYESKTVLELAVIVLELTKVIDAANLAMIEAEVVCHMLTFSIANANLDFKAKEQGGLKQ